MITTEIDRFFLREFGTIFAETELGKIVTKLPFFKGETRHRIYGLDGGPWIGGGALRRAMMGEPLGGDIDIFFRNEEQFNAFDGKLSKMACRLCEETDKRRIAYAIGGFAGKLDLVRGVFFDNTYQLLRDFDFTCCCVATDGETLTMDKYALYDNARRILRVTNSNKMKCSLHHMERYMRMGFVADKECLDALLQYGAAERARVHFDYSGPETAGGYGSQQDTAPTPDYRDDPFH